MTAEERKIVENKILELKKEMQDVHGSKCEVYSRVVGYLRPVQVWNKGKKEEFTMRKNFDIEHPHFHRIKTAKNRGFKS